MFKNDAQRKAVMAKLQNTGLSRPQINIIARGYSDLFKAQKHYNEQLRQGIIVEKEHTDNYFIAKKIAQDHLQEDKDYYTKLKRCKL
jgi:hypothetical protein